MAKKFTTNTSAFSIAHYILLFFVATLCITLIAWIMISRRNPAPQTNITTPQITHITHNTPCVQRTINTVAQMWAYTPESVPQKYWILATDYLNQPISTRTYGICQDVAFTCHPGQLRRDCDPCAVPSARAYAQQIHTADMIRENCTHAINTDVPTIKN